MNIRRVTLNTVRGVAILLVVAAVFSDFLSPNRPGEQNLENFFAPPTRIHFFDAQGGFHLRPFVYRYELKDPLTGFYQEQPETPYPLIFFGRAWGYRFWGLFPTSRHVVCSNPGAYFYPLGTDKLGRDVLSRILAGAKTSLLVVVTGTVLYAFIGLTVGALAGVKGGWVDSILMRFSEFVLALPALYLLLALRALLPDKLPPWQTMLAGVATIAAVTWPPMARGVRGLILQLQSAAYVEAAESLGCSSWQIFRQHMLPALTPFVLTQSAVAAPVFLLGEVFLSFLGVGFGDANESWGALLRDIQDLRVVTEFWWNLAPLAFVFATLLSLNVLCVRYREKEFTNLSL